MRVDSAQFYLAVIIGVVTGQKWKDKKVSLYLINLKFV